MVTEQGKTLEALEFAIRMEIDGKEYYLKISRDSSSQMGKKLLEALAAEEDIHRKKFEEIYGAIRHQQAWPVITLSSDRAKGLMSIFARATEESKRKTPATEFEAIQTAMSMENKTYDFYKAQERQAGYPAESDFYHSLAAQERQHHDILFDYYEYLKDPAAWFVKKEHPSLDGG